MSDWSHIPGPHGGGDVQVFNNPTPVTSPQWVPWVKPRGKSMFSALVVGGGGGGGGGFSGAAASARGGGGSGGSSGVTRVVVPLVLLPDILYVQVGAGGVGVGSGGGVAPSGQHSYISIAPGPVVANNILAVSSNAQPAGGGTGTGAAVGALGAGGTIATIALMPLAGLGLFTLIAGVAGVAGGAVAGAAGTAGTLGTTSAPFWAATSGAGSTSADFAGGAYTAVTNAWFSDRRPAAAAAGSNPGSNGFTIWQPFFSFGGGGGGASNAGVGGAGGMGGIGAGGGGGGAGTTGGRGGDGGPGIVIITCW